MPLTNEQAEKVAQWQVFPQVNPGHPGLTLLEYFAGQAITGALSADRAERSPGDMAKRAWAIAEEMVNQHPGNGKPESRL